MFAVRPGSAWLAVGAVGVGVIVAAAYWPVLSAQGFSLDDHQYVFENPLVQNPGWSSVVRFVREVWHPSTVKGYYQPLTMISLMVDYALGGRPGDLTAFHRTNLGLHVANVLLIIVLLHGLFGCIWSAAAVGLLFGVHPITVEPVAWLAERKTLLATFFALACLVAYVRYVRRPRRRVYVAALLLYVLALLAKPTSTPLVAVLLLLDYWPLRRWSWRAGLEKWPFFAVAAAGAVVTVVSQGAAAGLEAPTRYDPVRILLTLCHNIVFYLYVLVWPVRLTWHYPFPEPLSLSQPMVLAGVIGTVVLATGLLITWRWTRAPLTSWLIFFVAIFPTMNVIGFTYVIAGLKFVYLPAAGLLIGLAAVGARLWKGHKREQARRDQGTEARRGARGAGIVRRVVATLVVGLVAGLEIRGTRGYLFHWQEPERLHRYMLDVTPRAYAIRYNLAKYLEEQGRTEEALREYQRVLEQHPGHWKAHGGLGCLYYAQGKTDQAIAHLRESLRLEPNNHVSRRNLGIVLFESGRTEEAIEQYREAVRLAPDDFRSWLNLGNAHFKLEDYVQGIACYDQALRIRPDYERGYYNRGLALARLGRLEEAVADYRQALEIDANYAPARRQLEAVLERLEQQREP